MRAGLAFQKGWQSSTAVKIAGLAAHQVLQTGRFYRPVGLAWWLGWQGG
jgi:hypothetical protein